ncbi:Transcriptional regulatory protein UhpA [Corynebacterium occultum]|uniref:Transcriptional regulatory protein UhpA n=1 Tax=Corynebacterium occultum TaxID=2675219 RepID=A0A6B8W0L9_9CORY|nr:response regulator transcription factor [Corynebacterium occultum]QGU07064.1 Transcriptional regulatory protein UhpA [Corynebacterium occultum]
MTIRVLAIDDHQVTLLGVRSILAAAEGFEFVGGHYTLAEALDQINDPDQPEIDVVLLDLRLGPDSDPYDNVQALVATGVEVLIYSSLESPFLVRRAMSAGVAGILEKSVEPQILRRALEVVAKGGTYATAEWAGIIDADPLFNAVDLSPRQREVLELYAMGESAKRVATITGLAQETVQDYLGRIRVKYSLAGRPAVSKVELYQRAQEDGFLPGPFES